MPRSAPNDLRDEETALMDDNDSGQGNLKIKVAFYRQIYKRYVTIKVAFFGSKEVLDIA
jgi:hypothetical protein